MRRSEQINEVLSALSKAQGEIESAIKDSSNPFYKTNYADLTSVWAACRGALTKNGLSICQTMDENERSESYMSTILGHSSGQWIESILPLKYDDKAKNALQSLGSSITYLRRYMLASIVGITQEDDDANVGGESFKSSDQKKPVKREISESQITELNSILKGCSPDFVKSFFDNMNKLKLTFDNLTVDTYERMKASAFTKRLEYQNSLKEAQNDTVQVSE